ncbi:DUF4262 domain-containing protein [Streptomyces clavifer]|uniref:DUF4262 domain-containing protein n=1 Tax=Streptomyces clavifer TaxID=68188 RepID=UPI0033DC8CB9
MVPEDEVGPGYAYTIGLSHTHGAPELAMFGLDVHVMHRMLNRLGEMAASGAVLADGQEHRGVVDGRQVGLRRVDLRWYRTFFGRAIGFYRRPQVRQGGVAVVHGGLATEQQVRIGCGRPSRRSFGEPRPQQVPGEFVKVDGVVKPSRSADCQPATGQVDVREENVADLEPGQGVNGDEPNRQAVPSCVSLAEQPS